MAVAHDVSTRFPAGADTVVDTTTGDRTFTHTPSGTPKGVIVALMVGANVQGVTGVLYGGRQMRLAATAIDTDEAGRVTMWVLADQVVPTGAQTVTLQGCTADSKVAGCSTVTAATTGTTVNSTQVVNTTTSSNPVATVTTTAETMMFGAVHGGAAAPTSYAPPANFANLVNADFGAKSAAYQRRAAVAAGSPTFNYTFATSDDWCMAVVAIAEATINPTPPMRRNRNRQPFAYRAR
jgi:hypothetical protein